jgi:hypothetical protein
MHPARPAKGRLALALSLGLLGALAAPTASHAATIGPATIGGVDSVSYVAAPGEANQLVVQPGPGGTVSFVDPSATIAPLDATCVSVSAHEAQCAAALVPALNLSLGDGDDSATVDVNTPGVLSGDSGNDVLTGGDGDESLRGGDGDDVLEGRGGADLLSGEAGRDRVTYAGRTAPVTVDLTTTTTDREGEAGEHDTVASDVERVTGGAGNDRIVGNTDANQLDGGLGDDALDGRDGNDALAGSTGDDTLDGGPGNDTVAGGDGNDALAGSTGDDTLDGGAGNDAVDGGAGNDHLTGGSGADNIHGGTGNDSLRDRDGNVDQLNCGADLGGRDNDSVDADGNDRVSECEFGTPMPAPGQKPARPLTLPFDFLFGAFKLPDAPVAMEHGRVALSVSCPAATPSGRCSGVISLVPAARKHMKAKAHSSRRTKRFKKIGDQAYSVKAGKKAKIRVRISSGGRRAVNRAGTLKVHVYLRRTKRSKKATKIGTLKVHASRRTKRRHPAKA